MRKSEFRRYTVEMNAFVHGAVRPRFNSLHTCNVLYFTDLLHTLLPLIRFDQSHQLEFLIGGSGFDF